MLWRALDAGRLAELETKISYQLKTVQDLAVYDHVRDLKGKKIAEIGGGDSRILKRLAKSNDCYNIEKFEGADQGPKGEIIIEHQRTMENKGMVLSLGTITFKDLANFKNTWVSYGSQN